MEKQDGYPAPARTIQITAFFVLVAGWTSLLTTSAPAAHSQPITPKSQSENIDVVSDWTDSSGPIQVDATLGIAGPTLYGNLRAAFAAINAGTHQGVIQISVIGDSVETASALLNASGSGSSSYSSILITPAGTRVISTILSGPMIELNGADHVTIDGINAGGNSLTLSNAQLGIADTIRFLNGAQNNLITNCTILGSSSAGATEPGANIDFSTSISGPNSGNTISNNNLGPAGTNLPAKCILSLGSASPNNNVGNVIDNNNIFDFFSANRISAGISIQNVGDLTTISNNRIYQTAPRTFTTTGFRYNGILVSSGSATIVGNRIGFGAADGTGITIIDGLANTINGIQVQGSGAVATRIQNNIISGFGQTTSQGSANAGAGFIGISVGPLGAHIGEITENTIGSLDGTASIVINNTTATSNSWGFCGILDASSNSDVIGNNHIGSITINDGGTGTGAGFRGIRMTGSVSSNVTVSDNIIGGAGAGAITDNVVGAYSIYGIDCGTITSASPNLTCVGNVIRNIFGNATSTSALSYIGGIFVSPGSLGPPSTISQNTIHSLTNNATPNAAGVFGIWTESPIANTNLVVERNLVHSLELITTEPAAQILGIVAKQNTATYRNNMVRLGVDSTGTSITDGHYICGICDLVGANNFYFNTVYIGGTGVAASSNTFAFVSSVMSNARNYVDNVFTNARSNASGLGKNYAITVSGATPNPLGLISNYNDLYTPGVGGVLGLFNSIDRTTLPAWQAATGQDGASISTDPQLLDPTGTARPIHRSSLDRNEPNAVEGVVDLHIAGTSPCAGLGTPVSGITTDYDVDSRSSTNPAIGADEPVTNNISGSIVYCNDPTLVPVRNVTLTVTGTVSSTALSDDSGNYTISSLNTGGSYTITPSKVALVGPLNAINTIDVVAVQRHFLNLAAIPPGCRLTAADVNGDNAITTIDVIAIQRFFLGLSTGLADVGKYQFTPPNRIYNPLSNNQANQNYDALILGDVTSPFVSP